MIFIFGIIEEKNIRNNIALKRVIEMIIIIGFKKEYAFKKIIHLY